jgi:hypothetical protein
MFVRSAKLFVLAACIAGLPTTGFPYGGMYEKASAATGTLPCFIDAFRTHPRLGLR